jgi:hypothetical protein
MAMMSSVTEDELAIIAKFNVGTSLASLSGDFGATMTLFLLQVVFLEGETRKVRGEGNNPSLEDFYSLINRSVRGLMEDVVGMKGAGQHVN